MPNPPPVIPIFVVLAVLVLQVLLPMAFDIIGSLAVFAGGFFVGRNFGRRE